MSHKSVTPALRRCSESLRGKQRQPFSFKQLGIQAQGRTTILKLNYRNTEEILTLAYAFAQAVMLPTEDGEEDAPRLVQPQSAGRRGAQPELIKLPSFHHETGYLIERLQQLHERSIPWNEMAIVYRANGKDICLALSAAFSQRAICQN